jgi:succinate-acetate transporter protein
MEATQVKTANAGVLGLLAYGMTTILLSLSNSGIIPFDGMILAMALLFGGLAQTLVALIHVGQGDTFGFASFGGYSFLWLTFGLFNVGVLREWWSVDSSAIGAYLLVWMVFTIFLAIASTTAPRVLTYILVLTAVLLGMLAVGNLTGNAGLVMLGGYEGLITGALAMYMAFAMLLNESWGKEVLPLGAPLRK